MATIHEIRLEEFDAAVGLVLAVFDEFVRPDIDDAGWKTLLAYIDVGAARARNTIEHKTFVARADDVIVGLIEVRLAKHISLLVVDPRHFGQGIARRLLERALERCLTENPGLERLTVHSSRYALEVYRRLGFVAIGGEMVVDGIRFTPMALELEGKAEAPVNSNDRVPEP